MNVRHSIPVLIVCTLFSWAPPVRADVVTDWNLRTLQTLGAATLTDARPGPSGILDLAMVHAAMHDAIQAFEKRFETVGMPVANATGSPVAAAATAAHDVLVNRFPLQKADLDTFYDNYLGALTLAGDPGILVGQQAAVAIINFRAGDGSFPPPLVSIPGGTAPGMWRPTLPLFAPFAAPWLGAVRPYALKASDQFLADEPPPHFTSGKYTRDYNEVKALGARNSTARTTEQTELAVLFSGNFFVLLDAAVRDIIGAQQLDLGDSARLFALVQVASADAVITAWNTKAHYVFWRPITAIREGDNDGNPRTAGDQAWLPFIDTPPYPDYTSGANNVTAATMQTLKRFFGSDKMPFTLGAVVGGVTHTRDYTRFSDVERDVVDVRIYQGIHFRTADAVGRRQGKHVADWVFSHVLRPLN